MASLLFYRHHFRCRCGRHSLFLQTLFFIFHFCSETRRFHAMEKSSKGITFNPITTSNSSEMVFRIEKTLATHAKARKIRILNLVALPLRFSFAQLGNAFVLKWHSLDGFIILSIASNTHLPIHFLPCACIQSSELINEPEFSFFSFFIFLTYLRCSWSFSREQCHDDITVTGKAHNKRKWKEEKFMICWLIAIHQFNTFSLFSSLLFANALGRKW